MRYVLSLWVARRHRPFRIVKDPELLEIFSMLYAKVEVPHPTTVSRDVKEVHKATKAALARRLQVRQYYTSIVVLSHSNFYSQGFRGEDTPRRRRVDLSKCYLLPRCCCTICRAGEGDNILTEGKGWTLRVLTTLLGCTYDESPVRMR